MPLLEKHERHDYRFALWKMDEPESFFSGNITLTKEEEDYLYRITHPQRRKEWLAVRYLIQNQLNISDPIIYTTEGKPFFTSLNISISHSFDVVGVVVSPNRCALDIEKVHPRILKIAHRAFSPQELEFANTPEQLTVCWCIKETIFKLYGNGDVDFMHDLEIRPIENFVEGQIGVYFHKEKRYFGNVKLKTIDDYKLTWIIDCPTD